jgi:hypothetical protein
MRAAVAALALLLLTARAAAVELVVERCAAPAGRHARDCRPAAVTPSCRSCTLLRFLGFPF